MPRNPSSFILGVMGLLSFLLGCGAGKSPYQKKKGEWYYKDDPIRVDKGEELTPLNRKFAKSKKAVYYLSAIIPDADAATFQALGDIYAKDKNRVFYCDTYRDGQEYFFIKHIRTRAITGADPATFRVIDEPYARDAKGIFYDGTEFFVKDLESFQLLADNFAKDKIAGYYLRTPIAGSDGATFSPIDAHYSKDATHVFYSDMYLGDGSTPPAVGSTIVAGAQPATFTPLESGYGVSQTLVYHRGKILKGADAGTFEVLPLAGDGPTARDKHGSFKAGERLGKR